MRLTDLWTKFISWLSPIKISVIVVFVIVFLGLFHAFKLPGFHFSWPWEKSELQQMKDLQTKTIKGVKENDRVADSIQTKIDESQKKTAVLETKKQILTHKSTQIKKEISDAKSNIDLLDSLAGGVF